MADERRPVAHGAVGPPPPAPLYVEVSPLLYPELTGIGRFVARLIEALGRRTPLRLFVAVGGDLAPRTDLADSLPPGWEIPLGPGELSPSDDLDLQAWARAVVALPRRPHDPALASRASALFTWTRPAQRHFRRELCVLHDFSVPLLPWTHQEATRRHFNALYSRLLGLCDGVLAVSRSTGFDASWLSAIPAEKIVVANPGPSLCPGRHASERPVVRGDAPMLVVSTLEPRKNGSFLLDWFMTSAALPDACRLWWVGPTGWLEATRRAGERLVNGRREVTFLGWTPDGDLCELYRRTPLTIYPSLYEGFGFPVLDALLHGAPVMTSCNSSLQEFDGAGVFYFDPCDAGSLDDAWREAHGALPVGVDRPDLRRRCSWDSLAEAVISLAWDNPVVSPDAPSSLRSPDMSRRSSQTSQTSRPVQTSRSVLSGRSHQTS